MPPFIEKLRFFERRGGKKFAPFFLIPLVIFLISGFSSTCFGDSTLIGLSGTMLVPGLEVLPRGASRGAIHFTGTSHDRSGSIKGAFAFSDDSEVSIMKRFVTGRGKSQLDPVISGKYRLRPNLSVAAVLDTTEGYKDSVMILSGLPGNRVVLGVGANIALEGTETEAHFGRYPSKYSPVEPLFFLLGGAININPETEITMDYAGNEFVLGLRHHFNESIGFDFGYVTPDRVRDGNKYLIGMNFGF